MEWDAVYAGTFPYHDHGHEGEGTTLGLFGALIVHAPDQEPANEHVVILSDFDQAAYKTLPGVEDPETGEFHAWHIHGYRWLNEAGQLTDNIQLGPRMYSTFEFMEDKPGSWLVHCHVPDHREVGMMTRYNVMP